MTGEITESGFTGSFLMSPMEMGTCEIGKSAHILT